MDTKPQPPRNHYFLYAVELQFLRDGQPRRRTINIVSESNTVYVSQRAMREAQIAASQRLEHETGVTEDAIKDIVFLGISYMGHMTSEEFIDIDDPRNEPQPETQTEPAAPALAH